MEHHKAEERTHGAAKDVLEEARLLLKSVPLIDGHNDFPYMIRGWYANDLEVEEIGIRSIPIGQTDMERLEHSGLGGQFWSAFVPCAKTISNESRLQVLEDSMQQIDVVHRMVRRFPDRLGFAQNAADIWHHFRAGRLASLLGIEGLHQIAGSAAILRQYHRLGVRYVTLCHDDNNEYVDSATSSVPLHDGISPAGKAMILEMNRIGMLIDLSHTSHAAQRQTLRLSRAPVIFSHSSVYSLCEHARNVPDDILDQLKINNGLCMICFLPSLCKSQSRFNNQPCVGSIVDHIIYVGERIGYEHVGIGSDFDGMLQGPQGMGDVTCYPSLIVELLQRKLSRDDIKCIMGLNLLRVLQEVESKALDLQSDPQVFPLVDSISPCWTAAQREILCQEGERRGLDSRRPIVRNENTREEENSVVSRND